MGGQQCPVPEEARRTCAPRRLASPVDLGHSVVTPGNTEEHLYKKKTCGFFKTEWVFLVFAFLFYGPRTVHRIWFGVRSIRSAALSRRVGSVKSPECGFSAGERSVHSCGRCARSRAGGSPWPAVYPGIRSITTCLRRPDPSRPVPSRGHRQLLSQLNLARLPRTSRG